MSQEPSQSSQLNNTFLGHPKGLYVLFVTEMWERFSFYGMRAILALFLIAKVKEGGWGWSDQAAGQLAGMYGFMVYVMCIPGGIISDRYLGMRKATMWGAVLQCIGHFSLAFQDKAAFSIGIFLLSVGTGLLKTNISSIVGALYKEGDARRDVGFSIFYTGINLGGLVSPLVVGAVARAWGYHAGFTSAGVGMFLSMFVFLIGIRYLPNADLQNKKVSRLAEFAVPLLSMMGALAIFLLSRYTSIGFEDVKGGVRLIVTVITLSIMATIGYISTVLIKTQEERDRMKALMFIFIALFLQCMIFEQAAGFYTLYTERFISRKLWLASLFGWEELPSSFYQILNPLFVVIFGWFLANSFVYLKRKRGISTPAIAKMGIGIILLSLSCVVLVMAEVMRSKGGMMEDGVAKASSWFMVLVYWIQTISELCIVPVGLSFVTKVAPKRLQATLMGILWGVISCGYFMAGEVGALADGDKYGVYATSLGLFIGVFVVGILFLLVTKKVAKLSHGAEEDA